MLRLLSVVVSLLLVTGCGLVGTPHDAESLLEELQDLPGVASVDNSGDPWLIQVDTNLSAGELNALGEQLFDLVNDTDFTQSAPGFEAVAGPVRAAVEIDPETGGAPPGPPSLGWAVPLSTMHDITVARVTNHVAEVEVAPDADLVEWIRQLVAADLTGLDEHHVWAFAEDADALAEVRLVPAGSASVSLFEGLVAVGRDTDAVLRNVSATGHRPSAAFGVDDVAHAQSVVQALTAAWDEEWGAPGLMGLSLSTEGGERWNGDLDELPDHLDRGADLPALVAATGAELHYSSADHDSFGIAVPDADVLEELMALLDSPAWTPGPDSSVSIETADNPNASSLTAGQWGSEGMLLASALREGLTQTRITRGRGGSRQRSFDISFRNSDGIDITTPDGYGLVISLMRHHDWAGEAQIELSEGDHLYFWSTADGEAQDAYFALSTAPSRQPSGWALDFLAAWDATAG